MLQYKDTVTSVFSCLLVDLLTDKDTIGLEHAARVFKQLTELCYLVSNDKENLLMTAVISIIHPATDSVGSTCHHCYCEQQMCSATELD